MRRSFGRSRSRAPRGRGGRMFNRRGRGAIRRRKSGRGRGKRLRSYTMARGGIRL